MISLEQVRLLESKVTKVIDYVRRVKEENAALTSERRNLVAKLDSSQKRLGELELLVMRFKEDQGRIEDGIIAALDRLSQFEEAFESSLSDKTTAKKPSVKREKMVERVQPADKVQSEEQDLSGEKEFFEITKDEAEKNADTNDSISKEDELDIF
ncbi:MAG: cell division protein ZapB [Treponema sp.]|nr:cell division protein ZapB [Treponema sp.]